MGNDLADHCAALRRSCLTSHHLPLSPMAGPWWTTLRVNKHWRHEAHCADNYCVTGVGMLTMMGMSSWLSASASYMQAISSCWGSHWRVCHDEPKFAQDCHTISKDIYLQPLRLSKTCGQKVECKPIDAGLIGYCYPIVSTLVISCMTPCATQNLTPASLPHISNLIVTIQFIDSMVMVGWRSDQHICFIFFIIVMEDISW